MGKGKAAPPKPPAGGPSAPVKSFKYGMPLYGLAWPEGDTFYACGGGGHGIKNRLVCAEAKDGSLTDQTAEHLFGSVCPTRLAVAPGSRSIVFGVGDAGLRRLDLDARGRVPKFTEVTGALAEKLVDVKLDAKALAFHPAGELLAAGADDGTVAVFEWPSLKLKFELSGERKLSESIRDLDFVPVGGGAAAGGGKTGSGRVGLMVVLDNGSAAVLDVDKGGAVLCKCALAKGPEFKNDKVMLVSSEDRLLLHHLPPGMENAQFARVKCRMMPVAPSGGAAAAAAAGGEGGGPLRPTLVCLMNNRAGSHVALWELDEDGLLSMRNSCKVTDSSGTCMDASADGGLVAIGNSEGDVALVGTRPHMRLVKRFPKAHMVFCTAIAFNADASWLLSASADASATLNSTALPPPPDPAKFLKLAIIVLMLLVMIVLQLLRVLRRSGLTTDDILELIGLRSREEL
ncbi:hypothetical protein HYH02_000148 [Chlamydomonas schloesseri]|uniref:Anaphase-promoting complex subunit 4 WD40 domain-containing protein n=1 Tax=Chlamydomonas schloesseri TaxID=2026947 RepID=A0A835WLP0_9CHLO|nr:hypothetical protein HYH02_000148 [Chlamydomonas schloesseri]|eukprot:KAG2450044.1 hypothetical protein HYH02_000148 [Chlamydomonas schloesseri]